VLSRFRGRWSFVVSRFRACLYDRHENAGMTSPQRRMAQWAALAWTVAAISACQQAALPATPASSAAVAPELPSGWNHKSTQYADHDMVAAANPLAVDAGVAMLAQGGSAIDAVIAVQMMLTLVEPQSSGIGGGAFLLHYDPAARALAAYDGRETAPAAATPDMFLDASGRPLEFTRAVDGGLSVGTPGILKLFEVVHARHGKLPWATLFEPAIALAERGFPISPRLHTMIAGTADRLCAQKTAAAYFLKAGTCQAKDEGTVLQNPGLAGTLRALASGGARAFYTGPIADAIVRTVRTHPTNPGPLTHADLATYRVKERTPLCGEYRGYRLCGMPPPSSGSLAVLQTLGILQHFNVATLAPNSADAVHLLSEAYRLAFADRATYAGDPDFAPVPVSGLLDRAYLKARAAAIHMERSMGAATAGRPPGFVGALGQDRSLSLPSTSHVAIVDRDGRMANMTTTIENGFGSLQMVQGFLLNNQLTDFSLAPADEEGRPVANRVEPGKRPRSSMAPMVVFGTGGEIEAIVGSPGGSNIIHYVTKTLVGMIDWKLDVQQAIDLPNFGAQTSSTTTVERGTVLEGLEGELKARGHTVAVADINSGLQGIVFNGTRANGQPGALARAPGKGRWAGGADPRREGTARGSDGGR
jgi:gamma-glutamyltranspeptidase/glutathione hydrolase